MKNVTTRKSRGMTDGIMAATAELEAMMREGKRPEEYFAVHVIGFAEAVKLPGGLGLS